MEQPQQTVTPETTNSQPAEQSEVKAAAQTPVATAEKPTEQAPQQTAVADDSQATQTKHEPFTKAALFELEETLKSLDPKDVQQFQRELSAERGQNLFEGEIGELFKKYKPQATERAEKVKSMAAVLRGSAPAQPNAKPAANNTQTQSAQGKKPNLERELLRAKVELELHKSGVPNELLDDATIVAMSKIKSMTDIGKAAEVAKRYSTYGHSGGSTVPVRTSVGIGDHNNELSAGERAVAWLRQKNPKGWKN